MKEDGEDVDRKVPLDGSIIRSECQARDVSFADKWTIMQRIARTTAKGKEKVKEEKENRKEHMMDQHIINMEKERKDEGKVERKAKRAKAERKVKVIGKERAKEIVKARRERKAIGKESKEIGGQTGKEKAMHPNAIGKAKRKEAKHRTVQESKALGFKPSTCLLYTSPSPRDGLLSRMPSSA